MTIPELAEAATPEDGVTLTQDEALAIAETYQDACARCHVLTETLNGERAEAVRLLGLVATRDREILRLKAQAVATRVELAAALAGTAA